MKSSFERSISPGWDVVGWMKTALFLEWFEKGYVPGVEYGLTEKGLPPISILMVDNFSGHSSHVVSKNGRHVVLFLPPHTTSLIQPLDQEVIASIKQNYKKLVSDDIPRFKEEKGITTFEVLDRIRADYVVNTLNIAYDRLTTATIHHGWRNLLKVYLQETETELSDEVGDVSILSEEEVII